MSSMKPAIAAIISLLFLATLFITYSVFHKQNKSDSRSATSDPIKDGLKIYEDRPVATYTVDDYVSLEKLNKVTGQIPSKILDTLKQKYNGDPYKRLVAKNDFIQNLIFTPQWDPGQKLEYYDVNNATIPLHLYDTIFLKALYCDQTGYTESDFEILSHLDHRSSEYLSTSYLFALILLRENQCYDNQTLTSTIEDSAQRMARTEDADMKFSDIYAQRLVLLYWAGYGNLVQKAWIEKIRENYKPKVGWIGTGQLQTENRPTGFSLLALLYYQQKKSYQSFY